MFGSLFSSKSSSTAKTDISERTTNAVSESGAAISNALGGITVSADGKNARTNVENNISFTDYGALTAANETAKKALETVAVTNKDAVDFAAANGKQMAEALAQANENITSASQAALEEALAFGVEALSGYKDLADNSIKSADSALTRAFASAPGGGVDASRDIVKWVALAAVAALGVAMFVRR